MGFNVADVATGDWSGSIWHDTDAVLRSETNSNYVSTTLMESQDIALAGGDYIGIVLFLAIVGGTTGTITISLRQGGADIAGTVVTVNTSDFKDIGATATRGGPVFIKWPALKNLAAGNYRIGSISSVANRIGFWNNGTSNNFSRAIVFNATRAGLAGEDFYIAPIMTGPGAVTFPDIDYDVTAGTDWGSATGVQAANQITPALGIGFGCRLKSKIAAATNYQMRISGSIMLYPGSTFRIGNAANPLPTSSTFYLLLDSTGSNSFGIFMQGDATFEAEWVKGFTIAGNGDANIFQRLHNTLTTGQGTAAGSVQIGGTTGWAVGDDVVVMHTRSGGTALATTIAGIASGTTMSLAAGMSQAVVDGSATPMTPRSVILNRTRGIRIEGASSANTGYVNNLRISNVGGISLDATIRWRGVQFRWLGSSTTNFRGIDIAITGYEKTVNECVFRDCNVTTAAGVIFSYIVSNQSTNAPTFTFRNNIVDSCGQCVLAGSNSGQTGDYPPDTSTYSWITNNCISRGSNLNAIGDASADLQRNVWYAGPGQQITFRHSVQIPRLIRVHKDNEVALGGSSNGGACFIQGIAGTVENLFTWRNGTSDPAVGNLCVDIQSSLGPLEFLNFKSEGNVNRHVAIRSGVVRFITPDIQGGVLGNASLGIQFGAAFSNNGSNVYSIVRVDGGQILTTTSPLQMPTSGVMGGEVTLTGVSTTTLPTSANFISGMASTTRVRNGFIQVINNDNVMTRTYAWVPGGRLNAPSYVYDTTIFSTASPSLAIYPGFATEKTQSPTLSVAVAQGATATPSIKVRESVVGDGTDYNGARARLIVKRNALAGIATDTVLATATIASEGAWETLSGTTIAVARDCILEFYVDCDGTTGWINIDDFSCNSADTRGMQFYSENKLSPWVVGGTTGGGGGSAGFPLSRLVP